MDESFGSRILVQVVEIVRDDTTSAGDPAELPTLTVDDPLVVRRKIASIT